MDKNETGSILEIKKLLSCLFLSLLLHISVFTLHTLSLGQPASHETKLSLPSIQVSLISEMKSTTKPEHEHEVVETIAESVAPLESWPEHKPELKTELEPTPEPEPEQKILEPIPAIKTPSTKPAPKIIKTVVPEISAPKINAAPTPTPVHADITKLTANEHRLLKRAILSCQKYPESLRRRNLQGAVHVTFELDENPKLASWEVLSNEGHPDFIDAAHKTLLCLAAKNPLKRKSPKITVNLEFKLR